MELVRGVKITEFCDQNKIATEERLKLFIRVCQAIQQAHQKGIIRRDIKPSNILVTINEPGSPGVPKVIDFGIAKATQGRLTDQTKQAGIVPCLDMPIPQSSVYQMKSWKWKHISLQPQRFVRQRPAAF